MNLNPVCAPRAGSDTPVCASLAMHKVEIYSSPLCGYCYAAKRLLTGKGIDFKEYNVAFDASSKQEMLTRSAGRHTVPQIFINDVHVGGYDDLRRLDGQNELNDLLKST